MPQASRVEAVVDPGAAPGVENWGTATDKQLDDCFAETYYWYRVPPDARPG